jgi:hypothetical protein
MNRERSLPAGRKRRLMVFTLSLWHHLNAILVVPHTYHYLTDSFYRLLVRKSWKPEMLLSCALIILFWRNSPNSRFVEHGVSAAVLDMCICFELSDRYFLIQGAHE